MVTKEKETEMQAEQKTEQTNLVEVYVERGNANDEPNLLVGINGVNYLLPRGKTSKVPKEVAVEIERARKAQQYADEVASALMSQ